MDKKTTILTALLILQSTTPVLAEFNDYQEPEPWKEGKTIIPAYPKQGSHLIEFDVPRTPSRYKFLIDSSTLNLGADEVVRYNIVIDTGSAKNVFFDGIRCNVKQYKNYAYGVSGKMLENSDAKWQSISREITNPFRYALYNGLLCSDDFSPPFKVPDMIQNLKYPKN